MLFRVSPFGFIHTVNFAPLPVSILLIAFVIIPVVASLLDSKELEYELTLIMLCPCFCLTPCHQAIVGLPHNSHTLFPFWPK